MRRGFSEGRKKLVLNDVWMAKGRFGGSEKRCYGIMVDRQIADLIAISLQIPNQCRDSRVLQN